MKTEALMILCGMVTADVSSEPEGVNSFVGPVTFTISPRQLFSVRVFLPQDPVYVVRVTAPVDPVQPGDPLQPQDPIRPVTINTWGISFAGVIQQGNTVLNGQFSPVEPISPGDPA